MHLICLIYQVFEMVACQTEGTYVILRFSPTFNQRRNKLLMVQLLLPAAINIAHVVLYHTRLQTRYGLLRSPLVNFSSKHTTVSYEVQYMLPSKHQALYQPHHFFTNTKCNLMGKIYKFQWWIKIYIANSKQLGLVTSCCIIQKMGMSWTIGLDFNVNNNANITNR